MAPALAIIAVQPSASVPPVPNPVRKIAAGTLMGILLTLAVLVAVLMLVVLRRGRRRAARRARETDHRNAWAEAGRRLPTPEGPEERVHGGAS